MNNIKQEISDEQVQKIATIAVESYIRALDGEGMLNESADYILTYYSIVSYKKGFWGSLVEKLFKIDNDASLYFRTVKHIIHTKDTPRKDGNDTGRLGQVISLRGDK